MTTLVQQMPTAYLCPLCTSALEQDLRRGHTDEAHKLKSLKKSAKDGCLMCNWLWNSVPWPAQLEIRPAAPALDRGDDISFCRRRAMIRRAPEATWFVLGDWIYEAQPGFLGELVKRTIFGYESPVPYPRYHAILAPSETSILSNLYIPSVNTGASETFHLARQWMHKCISSHTACAAYRRPDWAPTRLLKIFAQDDGRISVKLQERDEGHYNSTVEYVALSHRWLGENEFPLLSKKNRSQLRDNIEISSLKASIRDAIFATLRLGIHYVWVDTLCILQHDEDDQKHEIGKMDSVYSNALCTIAAEVGETADEGCFSSRDVNEVRTHGVHLKLGEAQSQYYLLRLSWGEIDQELENASLARRGWTFQERFLSPRTMHFCAKQVHWECREFKANETHPEGNPIQSIRQSGMRFASMATPWPKIIESYTTRSLTFPTDRLRAIQGVADFLQRNSIANGQPDKYLHGIWQSSLPQSLLWGPRHPPKHDRLLRVAPTWSWASTDEEISSVYYHQIQDKPVWKDTQIIDTLEVVSGSDIRNTNADRIFETKDDVIKIRCRLNRLPNELHPEFSPLVTYGYKGAHEGHSENRYLPLYKSQSRMHEGHCIENVQGIVVRAIGDDSSRVYERVGKYLHPCRVSGEDAVFGEEEDIYLC